MSLINITLRTTGDEPDEPVIPDDPVPDDPVPDEPVIPDGPDEPVNPIGPVGPVGPDEPVIPDGPSGDDSQNNHESSIPVPNTGEYSQENSLRLTPLFVSSIIIAVIIILTIAFRRLKNTRKVFSRNKGFSIGSGRQKFFVGFLALLFVFSMYGVFKSDILKTETTNAESGSIAISASDIDLEIKRSEDGAVYGFIENEIMVVDGTENGYTLGVYAPNGDVVSEESEEDKITNISSINSALGLNTWGLSLEAPESQNSEVWNHVPGSQEDALILKSTDSKTKAYDTTSVYYGAYIGSDLPDGVYSGASLNYFVVVNVVPQEPDMFTLSFNANGGDGAPSALSCATTTTSCTIAIPTGELPTRNGYTFQGWADTSAAANAKYQAGQSIELKANKTIYAVWKQNVIARTLSFDANGGNGAPGSQSCEAKGTATTCSIVISSTVPSRSGYTFLGWGDTSDATTGEYEADETIALSSDKTIYAVWKEEQVESTFTLSFNANGGTSAPGSQSCVTITTSCTVTIPSNEPTRTNYTFKGWATTASADTVKYNPGGSVTLSKNTTIYAVWKNNYVIRFNANDGSGSMSDLAMVYGTAKNLTANAYTKTGFTFSGWNTKSNGSGTTYADKKSVNNLTKTAGGVVNLYAQWKSQTGKIHFISTGNSNAFLIESNGHYGLIDSSNPLYPKNNSDKATCMSKETCVDNEKYTVKHVVDYLNKVGVDKLDFIIASHSHSDHIGGMVKIARDGFVNSNTKYYYRRYLGAKEDTTKTGEDDWHNDEFYGRAIEAMSNKNAKLIDVTGKKMDEFFLGDFGITILNTELATEGEKEDGVAKDENVNSLVVLATIGDKKVLFAGDMEEPDENKIANKVGKVNILQMGHHGVATSTSLNFMKKIMPENVIIPSASFSYQYRRWGSIAYAAYKYGTKFYMTGYTEDAIIATFKNNAYQLSAQQNSRINISLDQNSGSGQWVKFDFRKNNIVFWSNLESNETASKGWKKLKYDGRTDWYYFDANGRMLADEWTQTSGAWYYLDSDGRMAYSGWRKIKYQGKLQWFFFDGSGKMVTGGRTINGKYYQFDDEGVCYSGSGCPNTTPYTPQFH